MNISIRNVFEIILTKKKLKVLFSEEYVIAVRLYLSLFVLLEELELHF